MTDQAPPPEVEPRAVEPSDAEPSGAKSTVSEPTVRERLSAAGLSAERIDQHLAASRIRVDGELVDDLDQPAPEPARVVLWAP